MDSTDRQPVPRSRFEDILREELATLTTEELKIYETYATAVLEQRCYRDEHYGMEKVFVVARAGTRLLVFDDVEDEFAIGDSDNDGILRKWDLYGPLVVALRNLKGEDPVE